MIVSALQNKVFGKFDSLDSSSTCEEIADSVTNSNLDDMVKFDLSMGTLNSNTSEIRYSNVYDSNYFIKEGNTIKALQACKIKIYGGAICGNIADSASTIIYKNGISILSESTHNTGICLEVNLNIGDVLSFSLSGYRVTGRFFAI